MNCQLRPIDASTEYPPEIGNHFRVMAKISTTMIANQKYGIDEMKVVMGTSASSQVPRREPASMPRAVPMTKPSTVQTVMRISVHQMLVASTWLTVDG